MSVAASTVAVGRNERGIEDWLESRLAELLGLETQDIATDEPFSSYGLDSIAAVSLAGDLEDWLGLELAPTVVWEHPTIERLARHLAESVAAETRS